MTPFTLFSLFSNDKKASPEIFFANAHKLSKPIFFIYIEFTPHSPCVPRFCILCMLHLGRGLRPIFINRKTPGGEQTPPRVFSIYSCMAHCHRVDYSIIVATLPAPTVLPPSRSNRKEMVTFLFLFCIL